MKAAEPLVAGLDSWCLVEVKIESGSLAHSRLLINVFWMIDLLDKSASQCISDQYALTGHSFLHPHKVRALSASATGLTHGSF